MKRSRLLPALGLFAGALFWGCFSDKSVDPTSTDTVEELQLKGSISGTVTDSVNHGISGVAVTLDSGGFATNTDSLGRYTIPDVPGRTWTVRFTKTNWADTSIPGVVLAIDEDRKGVDMRMRRKFDTAIALDTTGSFAGTVRDTAGKPLSNVNVLLVGAVGQSTVTDSVGGFVLSDVPAGSWGISFGRSGYADTAIAGLTIARKEKKIGIVATMRPVPVQIIDTTGSFAGVVMDTALKPLSGVTVMVVGQTGLTTLSDSVGNFAIKKIPAGTWGVRFAKFGYDDTIFEQEPLAAKEVRTGIVAKLRPLTLDSGRFLSGTLSDLAGFKTLEVSALSRTTGKAIPVTSLLWTASGNWTAVLGTSRDSGTLSLVARDSAGHATGYLSHSFAAATGPLPVPAFPVHNAVPKVEAGSNATVSVGRTHLLKAQATDSLTNAGIASVEWSCGTSTTWSPEGANGLSFVLPRDSGSLICRVRAADKDSNVVTDSLVLNVVNTPAKITGLDDVVWIYTPTVSLALQATDAEGVAKILWNFGDGTTDSTFTGTSSAVKHSYYGSFPHGASFIVTVNVIDSLGGSTSFKNEVALFNNDAAIDLTFDTATITPNDTVTYTATISDKNGVAKVLWNFGDGTIDTTYTSGTVTKKHAYPSVSTITARSSNTYPFSITVLDSIGGESTKGFGSKKVINDIPTVTVNDTAGDPGTQVTLHAMATDRGRIVRYEWSVAGGTFVAGGKDTTITLPLTGPQTYFMKLRAIDEDGNTSVEDSATICTWGRLNDSRDGKVYRTTNIGSQVWMAQNLNYTIDSSWWPSNNADSGKKYGRLYRWASVIGLHDSCNTKVCEQQIPSPNQGICPIDWHVPTKAEWHTLALASGGYSTAGLMLKSKSGWQKYSENSGNGIDKYGFESLPAGYRENGHSSSPGAYSYWWTTLELSSAYAGEYCFSYVSQGVCESPIKGLLKTTGFALRCVKN